MATWPGTLPQVFLYRGYKEVFADNVVKHFTGVGPPKIRRRSTAAPQPIKGELLLTAAQLETLRTFFNTTISYGSVEFDWTHPTEGSSVSVVFSRPPEVYTEGNKYRVILNCLFKP